ncbi:sensor histidine kinase [Niallia nealsonii]|uniref:Two-component sensor histidine kinase n=1 Tax=Niallia nealsonii TaxID=115979 RepID=A0A2N0Z823_9BACI|nr:sensor histidine kinase [Niallia nealsonii]PKG25657.1 two-component sensor histidine kinase [Niallia nealsonii]
MNFTYSLRLKLTIFYFFIIVIPVLIISFAMPRYYQYLLAKETKKLTEDTLTSLSNNIQSYLDELSRLTITPYLNEDILSAISNVSSNNYKKADPSIQLAVNRALYNTLPKYLDFTREEVQSILLVTTNGAPFLQTRFKDNVVSNYDFTSQDWYIRAQENNGKVVFIPPHFQKYIEGETQKKVISAARLIRDPISQKPLAVLLADADNSAFEKLFRGIDFNNKGSIMTVMDSSGELFFSSKDISNSIKKDIFANKKNIQVNDHSYTTVSKVIKPGNWKIIVLLSNKELAAKTRLLFIIGAIFACIGFIVTFFLFYFLSNWIIRPFKDMVQVMEKVEKGNFDVSLAIQGTDEVAQLKKAFNSMIFQINDLINREYRAVLNQRNAEFKALQSQIQPHFLYNTLNGFIGLNRIGDKKTLERAILSLSSMLRYSLHHSNEATIADEFSFLKQYCLLQKLRFQDRMEVEIYCEEGAANLMIPKLLLQPFVENSIIHGIEPSDHCCKICISAQIIEKETQKYLQIIISDNGIGFNLNKTKEKQSIGLSNSQERLKLFQPESLLVLKSEIGAGTTITIEILQGEWQNESADY